jgi:hypothetical protein
MRIRTLFLNFGSSRRAQSLPLACGSNAIAAPHDSVFPGNALAISLAISLSAFVIAAPAFASQDVKPSHEATTATGVQNPVQSKNDVKTLNSIERGNILRNDLFVEISRLQAENAELRELRAHQDELLKAMRVDPASALRARRSYASCEASVLARYCPFLRGMFQPQKGSQ